MTRTPDEIKRWLACPLPVHYHIGDTEARLRVADRMTLEVMHEDAINLIVQLEADNAQQARCIENLIDNLNATNDALPRWISVEERLPEKGVFVVVYYGHFFGNLMDVYMWDGECWRSCSGFLEDAENITHWMPLPEPPKEVPNA